MLLLFFFFFCFILLFFFALLLVLAAFLPWQAGLEPQCQWRRVNYPREG